MSLTAAQQSAIAARGNVLVVAGAGTGKTSTLVERCLRCLTAEDPPVSLDEILIVTFTDAAAAEMRQRIRAGLEKRVKDTPLETRWHEQLALFEAAQIGTLHSFCLRLVRQYFHELELDPQLSVLAEAEARLLADETLDELLQRHYSGGAAGAGAVLDLIQTHGGGWDEPIRRLVLRLHHYTQTLPDAAGWFAHELAGFASDQPERWEQWLLHGIARWRQDGLEFLDENALLNQIATNCSAIMRKLPPQPARSEAAAALAEIAAIAEACPYGNKIAWLEPLKDYLAETHFLLSLARATPEADPLQEDWAWVRTHMVSLLQLALDFKQAFAETKRELGVVDFHDLEQYTLRLLWDNQTNAPTPIATQWREKLRFVFVDEYQDINAAQDRIIAAISRSEPQANRFLVGDVKQSIYRFRLANPRIFQQYVSDWSEAVGRGTSCAPDSGDKDKGAHGVTRPTSAMTGPARGCAIALVENFRSREPILKFVNSLFGLLMRRELGGVEYDQQAQLQFGAPDQRPELRAGRGSEPLVEIHLRLKGSRRETDEEDEDRDGTAEIANLADADKEARALALRLLELKAQGYPVWDESRRAFRPVEWRDMAILLRAPAGKAESYAKEFARLAVPLVVERGGFYQSIEISDLLSLLRMLDNPQQDVPVLAVLHSPLVGLTTNELATIRLSAPGPFWTALLAWNEDAGTREAHPETSRKIGLFLERFGRWRRMARQVSLSRCLDAILAETHYSAWLLTQPRGEQRQGNVERLVGLAQRFDQFQRQGLFRFLGFIDAQQAAEAAPEVAAVQEENSVRLMSIHQSKGLEFPIVAVADLGKRFNLAELRSGLILDEEFGLCPQIKPPHTGKRYPSLPYWLARRRQEQELLGEELRLLYVATTRAKDKLLLIGTVSESRFEKFWKRQAAIDARTLGSAQSYCDWLGSWFSRQFTDIGQASSGEDALARWQISTDKDLSRNGPPLSALGVERNDTTSEIDAATVARLRERLAWQYPFGSAPHEPAKASVSALRRRATRWPDEDAAEWSDAAVQESLERNRFVARRASKADAGSAHHVFLQRLSFEAVGDVAALAAEAQRLQNEGLLTEQESGLLDLEGIAAFWASPLGREIRSRAEQVQRELAFTARFSADELAALTGQPVRADLEREFVVVQGIADLVLFEPAELWLLDFKTDRAEENDLAEKVKLYEPQLRLYALALSRIYGRPVTRCWLHFLAPRQAVSVNVSTIPIS